MVEVAGLGSSGPEFELLSAVEWTPGGVNSACHSPEVGEMSTDVLVIGALRVTPTATSSANDAMCSFVLHMKEEEEVTLEIVRPDLQD